MNMGTTFEEIECQAMTYIKNDLSLDWDMKYRLPVFYRRMWNYMEAAKPMFNRPPQMICRLKNYTAPEYSDVLYPVTELGEDGKLTVNSEITGMDICSAGVVTEDEIGNPTYLPLTVDSYDSETGVVVISGDVSYGQTVDIDFYKSGSLDAELTDPEKDILAFCVYAVYEKRFDNNILERTSKVRDASFTTISEASQTSAGTSRQTAVDNQLFEKLRKFEQDWAYYGTVLNRSIFN